METYVTEFRGTNIVFLVSTLLPYEPNKTEQSNSNNVTCLQTCFEVASSSSYAMLRQSFTDMLRCHILCCFFDDDFYLGVNFCHSQLE
ncbi:unnamed protein product [Schistosoma mattheei]|uniref:Uncharacterized protein n=1 Tax=Schistosoma mattheei TaxID=31246 RepID=A0A3P8CAF3_9TREM|nr:unnamed protein product [Schistosoma mattheei]